MNLLCLLLECKRRICIYISSHFDSKFKTLELQAISIVHPSHSMDLKRKRENDEYSVDRRAEGRVVCRLQLDEPTSKDFSASQPQVDLFHLITTDEPQQNITIDKFQRLVNSNRGSMGTASSMLQPEDAKICPAEPLSATYSQLRSLAYKSQPMVNSTHITMGSCNANANTIVDGKFSDNVDTTNVGAISDSTSSPIQSTTGVASIPSSSSVPTVFKATMYFDGGALGNPGKAGAGYLLYPEGAQPPHINPVESFAKAAVRMKGICTNNQAEYMGLIHGLQAAIVHKVTHLTVFGDSELVIKQMKGLYKVKNPILQVLNAKAQSLARQLSSVSYNWVERSKNKPADALSNVAMYQPDLAEECADFDGK